MLVGQTDFIVIGKIVGVHGVKGNLKVHSYAESLDIFTNTPTLLLTNRAGQMQPVALRWAKPHGRQALLSLQGVDTREAAELLVGSKLSLHRDVLPELEEDTYYWFDLLGLRVLNADGVLLGTLKEVMPTAGHDVYVVTGEQGEILIPAIAAVVQQVDLKAGEMRVALPEEPV